MKYSRNRQESRARAFPVSDAQELRLTSVESGQGLPRQGRARLKKKAQTMKLRIGSINVGSMTGKGGELVDMLERRKVEICCVQETRWRGNKARPLGRGYKLIYSGTDARGRNGVGVILNKRWQENVVEVSRVNDRIIKVKVMEHQLTINVIAAYAPQRGCAAEEKEEFWRQLDSLMGSVAEDERIVLGGDLNGHIGQENGNIQRVHGGWGVGERNEEGEQIIDFSMAFGLAIVNTFFKKKEAQMLTYKSGDRESQIDLFLSRRKDIKEITNCKVIKGESVCTQHRLVVIDLRLVGKIRRTEQGIVKTKWWKMKDEEVRLAFKEAVSHKITDLGERSWDTVGGTVREVGEQELGKTSGKRTMQDKESWWWTQEVQAKVQEKKVARKRYDETGSEEDHEQYKISKKNAKKAVAVAKAASQEDFYEELDTKHGQRKVYSIAKQRDKATKDLIHVRHIKDEQGRVLYDEMDIKQRWKNYFELLLNVENPRQVVEYGQPNDVEVEDIGRQEVKDAIKKMKNEKAVGPDEIPVEVWKALGDLGDELVYEVIHQSFDSEEMPNEWRGSTLVPVYKGKGDIQDCGKYRGIKLMSHTMKIYERVLDKRLRGCTEVTEAQFGFMPGRSATDAIFAMRQLMEKYREKRKELHIVFIDLEKAYDRIPREEVWRCMREKGVPEKYVRVCQDMYREAYTQVRTAVGMTDKFPVTVGLHQGSALSPYLFNLVMDVMVRDVLEEAPWTMLFADDIVLVAETREELEQKLNRWRDALESRGLKISREKTEYMQMGGQDDDDSEIHLVQERLKKVETFKYLGTTLSKDGELDREINARIQAGWNNWRKCSGLICDRKVSARVKGKVYRSVVRPAMIYGSETWPLKKSQERKMEVAEMRMLRWMLGVTRRDRIRNERIRGTAKVTQVGRKIQERRLQWYGHCERREEEWIGRRMMVLEVGGGRGRGRPRRRWRDCVEEDLREKSLSREEALNRREWKRLTRNRDPI